MCQQQKPTKPTATVAPLELKKQVHFGEIQQHFLAPLPQDLQRQHMYYSAEELHIQKQTDINTFEDLESDECFEEGICFRGLETATAKTERRRRVRNYIHTVLEVHFEQKEMGYNDDYELYIVARANSKNARKKAQKIAAQDADDVLIFMADESFSTADTFMSASSHSISSGKRRRRSLKKFIHGSVARVFSSKSSSTTSKPSATRRLSGKGFPSLQGMPDMTSLKRSMSV